MSNSAESLIDKIRNLPPEKIAEVEDFVDFLRQRSQPTVESREQQFQQHLLALGIITAVKPPITDLTPYQNRKPIEVTGKPTSEVIIEDRG